MSIVWKPIDDALFDWVLRVFPNLVRSHIQMEDQNLPQPPYPYVTFKKDSLISNGSQDETRETTDLTKSLGQEVAIETVSVREFTLAINAHVDEDSGSRDPDRDAFWMMTELQANLSSFIAKERFELAGISIIEELGVTNLSQTQNGVFFSKANLDIRFRVCFSSIERTGYIDSVNVKSVPSDPPQSDDVSGIDITT